MGLTLLTALPVLMIIVAILIFFNDMANKDAKDYRNNLPSENAVSAKSANIPKKVTFVSSILSGILMLIGIVGAGFFLLFAIVVFSCMRNPKCM
ncbi:hypothetical protein HYS00_02925 [Candidatus Microgenomates bacterium]|nr:hypothetical protein [Candidatus Microgenomates bacterium]